MSRGGEKRNRLEAAAKKLYATAEGDPRRLAMIAAQFQVAAGAKAGGTLEVVGMVGLKGNPVVEMTWGENQGQIDPEAARSHALLVLEAAQNAVNDAAVMDWARNVLELDEGRAAMMIDALRQHRADRWGQPDLELEFERPPPEEPA